MSTLEKFGILVILILVVIIGVVAVWGVGGEKDNPFAQDPAGENVAAIDPNAPPSVVEPGKDVPGWTNGVPPAAPGTGAVPPPALGSVPNVPGPGAEMASAPPAAAGATTYTVLKGDTGASIAKKTLGDANKWKLISAANGNKDARRLKINEVLKIPAGGGTSVADSGLKPGGVPSNSFGPAVSPPVNPADGPTETHRAGPAPVAAPVAAPAAVPDAVGREVEVRSGDTLYEIARRELGDPNLYYKIIKANPGLDPKKIRPGMKIKLPAL